MLDYLIELTIRFFKNYVTDYSNDEINSYKARIIACVIFFILTYLLLWMWL